MPIYEYSCKECGKLSDVLQKLNDPAPEKCPGCGAAGSLSRVVSRTSFVLKGGGWYSDLYGSAKKESKSESAPAGSPPTATSTSPPATSGASSSSAASSTSGASSSSGSSGSGSGSGSSGGDKK